MISPGGLARQRGDDLEQLAVGVGRRLDDALALLLARPHGSRSGSSIESGSCGRPRYEEALVHLQEQIERQKVDFAGMNEDDVHRDQAETAIAVTRQGVERCEGELATLRKSLASLSDAAVLYDQRATAAEAELTA